MKKVLYLVLACVLMLSLFAGCGKTNSNSANNNAAQQQTASESQSTQANGSEEKMTDELIPVKYVLPRGLECLDDAHVWAAIEMGYFKDEGLDVSIEQSIGTTDVKMVSFGQSQFCIPSPVSQMVAHEAGMPLISVMQCDTRQIFGICVKEDSEIKSMSDLKGKKVVLGDASWQSLFEVFVPAAGLEFSDITYVVGGENRAQMVDVGQADAVFTWEKEYQLWQAQGLKLRYITGEDLVPGCANSIATTRDMVKNDPELIEKFCRAYAKGIYFCKCNPEAATDIVLKKFPALNLTLDQALPAIKGLVHITNDNDTETKGYGYHNKDEWQVMKDGALLTKSITEDVPVEEYYTNEFIEAINNFDKAEVEADAAAYKVQ
jgi:NitT/TauT family transport system substrate-binding protein